MKRVALTGGIATGKSHVRAVFDRLGVPTIDADVLARDAVAPGTAGLAAVVRRFGAGVLAADGTLDRHRLAEIVFADAGARKDLEGIIHPAVRDATDTFFAALDSSPHPFAVADIPLLYEVGRDRDFEVVIVAAVDPETQVRRVVERDGLTEAEARARLAAQLPIGEKVTRADYVIDTGGTFDDTERQVKAVVDALRAA
ncbi:MAG: dephospho-CoA kinase [Vicinamibacterales bacterium]